MAWLVDMLDDAGNVRRELGFAGVTFSSLGWVEINAWVSATQQHDIPAQVLRDMMHLSAAYAAQINILIGDGGAECPPPYNPDDEAP